MHWSHVTVTVYPVILKKLVREPISMNLSRLEYGDIVECYLGLGT